MPGRSDVDMLLVAADRIDTASLDRMALALLETARECPGRELESSIVTVSQAAAPAAPWPFVLHVVTGPGGSRVQKGAEMPGDTDLLMHYAVCRAAGWAVHGPAPRELIGSVARPAILGYLAAELGWGLEHRSEAYAVLNACRAAIYLADGQIVSKVQGGETALGRGSGPADVIRRALAQQRGTEPGQPPELDAVEFVLATAAALRSAAAG